MQLVSTGLLAMFLMSSCGQGRYAISPVSPAMSYGSLSKHSVSTSQRTIVKNGNLKIKVRDIRKRGRSVETIVSSNGGFMTSLTQRDDTTKHAQYNIKVPAENMVNTMDQLANLGKVTYRRIKVTDVTQEVMRQVAVLKRLKARRSRLKSMFSSEKDFKNKLEIEKTLSEIEEEIFSMEEAIKQAQKTSRYSKIELSLKRTKIRGPVGMVTDAGTWSWKKLFTIRE